MPRLPDATQAVFADAKSLAFEQRLALLAPTGATVLISGETGTGKEVAARELHRRSGRKGPFLAVNCGALSETLAESELFGHEKGAFTGALRGQAGWFEAAAGGTLLLDEIGELSLPMQVRLLRVLQEREVTRVGARTPRPIDVRIVAATNVDLERAVQRGTFRADLLFRLNVASVTLRPLRERIADIEPLAERFLALYGARCGRDAQRLTEDAMAAVRRYPWPGNVRELDNVMHRAVLLNAGPVIDTAGLCLPEAASRTIVEADAPAAAETDLEESLRRLATSWIRTREPDLLRRATGVLVQASFDEAGGNQVRAADLLGVSRNTLRTQLGHLGMIAPRRRAQEIVSRSGVRMRVGIQRFGTSALLRVGGELEQRLAAQKILVDWREFETGPPLVAALQSGEVDVCSVGEVPPVFAQSHGAPVVYLAYESASPSSVALVVRCDSAIRSMHDLQGKHIALSEGANVHFLLLCALEACGMTLADVNPVFVPLGTASGPDALPSADAWMMWDPFLSAAQLSGQYRVLLDGTGLVSNHRFYLARRDFTDMMPEAVHAFLEEARRVALEAAAAPAEAAQRLAASFGMMPAGLELSMRRLASEAKHLDWPVLRDQQRIADRFFALGLLPRTISVEDAVWR